MCITLIVAVIPKRIAIIFCKVSNYVRYRHEPCYSFIFLLLATLMYGAGFLLAPSFPCCRVQESTAVDHRMCGASVAKECTVHVESATDVL